jgi:Uma2 family endonuclease
MPNRATVRVMSASALKPMTQDEFFTWAQKQDRRYEFDGFQPVAMTGGSNNAGAIGARLIRALGNRLEGKPCQPLGPDNGVETANKKVCYPDALVTCTKFKGDDHTVPGVVVVFEIVGTTPEAIRRDKFDKVRQYATVSSIRRYVIIESQFVGLTVYERDPSEQFWTRPPAPLTDGEILSMPEIGIEIPVDELYRGIIFPTDEETAT